MVTGSVRCACDSPSILGEGPLWVARENAVYWVDIKGKALHRLGLTDDVHCRWPMPEMLCWIVERANAPGFLAGFRNRFARLELDPLRVEPLGTLEPRFPDNRLNDAAVHRDGSVWAGTMDDREQAATGALYRLDPEGQCVLQDEGYIVSNGPAFSPAHDVLYHTDTARGVIYRFVLQPDGRPTQPEVFVRFAPDWGLPDGMATDEDGGIWVAHWGGARVSRFSPDGELDRVIDMPAVQITSCCFAGPDLERMFVTSAAVGREDEPLAGCLFEVSPGIRGAPVYAYGG